MAKNFKLFIHDNKKYNEKGSCIVKINFEDFVLNFGDVIELDVNKGIQNLQFIKNKKTTFYELNLSSDTEIKVIYDKLNKISKINITSEEPNLVDNFRFSSKINLENEEHINPFIGLISFLLPGWGIVFVIYYLFKGKKLASFEALALFILSIFFILIFNLIF